MNEKYLSPKQVFNIWKDCRVHFTQAHIDITKTRTKGISDEAFAKRHDIGLYSSFHVTDYREFVKWYLAYVSYHKGAKLPFIVDLIEFKVESPEIKKQWENRILNLSTVIDNDVSLLALNDFKECFYSKSPIAYSYWEQGKISTETLTILDETLKLFEKWDKTLEPKFIWKEKSKFLKRYGMFINKDVQYMKNVLQKHFLKE